MSTKSDVVNLIMKVNGDQAKKEFQALNAEAAQLRSELKGMTKVNETWRQMNIELAGLEVKYKQLIGQQKIYQLGSEQWKKVTKEISDVSGRMVDLRTQMKEVGKNQQEYIEKSSRLKEVEGRIDSMRAKFDLNSLSIKDLRKEILKLKSLKDTLNPLSEDFENVSRQVQVAEKRMLQLQRGGTALSRTFDFLKKEALGFGVVMLGALGIDYVIGKIGNLIQKNADLSDSFSDVRKTTGLSATEIEELNKELKGLNTRTPRKELLDLASEAGKLNITGKKNILEFVDTANKIKVALGKDLGENAVEQITKLSQIFKLQEKNGISLTQSLTKVGNVINKIGAESTASEGYLVDFLSRTGGVASQAEMTIQQITALASAADQLNLSAEVTATTFNQILPDMFTNTAAYAQIAGVSTLEFGRILNTDANQALMMFLEGLNGNNAGLGMMSEKLKDVEIDGTRGIAVLASLAQNTDKIKTALKSANQEFATGSSMIEEYNLRNGNMAGNIERIRKAMSGWFQSSDMIRFFQAAFGWMAKLLDIPLSKKLEDERLRLYQIEIQLKNTNLKQEDRLKLLKELQEKYPAYFKNMDLEKANNIEIAKAIRLVNDELINKIIIQKKQEEIDKQNDKVAKRTIEQMKKQTELELEMARIAKKYKLEIPDGSNVVEQARKLYDMADAMLDKGKGNAGRAFKGGLFDPLNPLAQMIYEFPFVESELKRQNDKVDKLLSEREQLMQKLGISNAPVNNVASNTTKPDWTPKTTEKDKKEADKAKQDLDKFLKDIDKLRNDAQKARTEVIQEELDRELKLLEFEREQKNKAINDERDRLVKEAVQLKQGKAVIEQIHADSFAQIVANNEQFYKASADLREKYEKELKEEAYQRDIKNLNDAQAAQRLFYSQLYAQGKIDKSTFDQNISDLDKSGKQQLLDIAKQYGIDVVKVQQDITNDEIKVLQDRIEKQKRLYKRRADFAVELVEWEYEQGKATADDVYKAKYEQLGVELANELELVGDNLEEQYQLYQEFILKLEKLKKDHKKTRAEEVEENFTKVANVLNEISAATFSFAQELIQKQIDELERKSQKEKEILDRDYKNRLVSDVDYINKKRANELKLDKEMKEMKRKQAIADKAQALFNIGLATAQSLIQLWVNPGFPAAIPMAITVGMLGAMQAAFVAAKPIPQYYDGGYAKVQGAQDGRTYTAKKMPDFQNGYLSNPALVLAGERGEEYFVNNTALQNPDVKYVVDGIEQLTRGKINSIDFRQMLAMPALQQKYTGGYVGQTTTSTAASAGSGSGDGNMISMMYTLMSKLSQQLDGGIQATAVIPDKTITDFKARENYLNSIEEDAN